MSHMISSYRIVYQSSDRQHAGSDPPACSSIDLNANPGLLGPYACMVIGGHDEYWTRAMREHTQRFVGNGGNLIVLSGNTAYRAVRLEDNNTRVVFHKYPSGDPNPKNEDATVAWADPPLCNPPNVLFGAGWTHGAFGATNGSAFYTLRFPSHWVFAGVAPTRQTSAFMSYETDAAAYIDEPEGYPRVTGEDGSPRIRDLASEVDRKRSKCNAGGVCIHRRPNPHGTASQTRRGNQPR